MKSTSRGEGGGSVHTTVDTIHTVPSLRLFYLARDIETCGFCFLVCRASQQQSRCRASFLPNRKKENLHVSAGALLQLHTIF